MGSKAELVDWVSGAAMLIRREVVEQLGGLDEEYFLYFEETDFCRKAHSGGWSVAFVPGSCVMHNAGASTGIMNEQARSKQLPAYWFESRRRFFAKNYGVPYACATDVALAFACLLGHVKRAALGRTGDMPAKYLGDVLRHSALWSRNRQVKPAREYQPRTMRQ
jgi:GT2 family glycosyltransferase